MASMSFHVKRLERLADQCGVGPKREETPQVDTENMSEYEKQQYKTATILQRVRGNILELDNLNEKASITRKSELSQAIRRDLDKVRQEAAQAKKLARQEDKRSEYEALTHHVKKTEALYQQRFRSNDDEAATALASGGNGRKAQELDEEMSQLGKPMMNLRDDEEFQMFFNQVQKNDQVMDQALDRISAGVQVLHNQAVTINQEIKVQNELLTETEEKAKAINTKLTTLNKRLKKTIKEVQKDKLCIYLICFVLLLALGGVIYWQITENSKDDK